MNKTEFLEKLRNSLNEYGVKDAREIITDFEQHFEDGIAAGETEAQVCEKLGDPSEIAKQYISDEEIPIEEVKPKAEAYAESTGFDTNNYNHIPPVQPAPAYTAPQQQSFTIDGGKAVLVILVDLFVLIWALPTLVSLIISLYGIVFALFGSGIGCIVGGTLMSFADTSKWLFSSFSPISTVLFGTVSLSACALSVIGSIAATKGFINLCKVIINWHSETFAGHPVCEIKKKEKNGEAT